MSFCNIENRIKRVVWCVLPRVLPVALAGLFLLVASWTFDAADICTRPAVEPTGTVAGQTADGGNAPSRDWWSGRAL